MHTTDVTDCLTHTRAEFARACVAGEPCRQLHQRCRRGLVEQDRKQLGSESLHRFVDSASRRPHHPLAVRTTITLACFVFGLVLVGLRFLSLPLTDAFQPYVLYAGIGLLLLGVVLVITRRSREETPTSRGVQPAGDFAVLEPAPPVAPPRAEVALLVGGNGASEPSVRWYHVAAATLSGVAAPKARISVAVRGEA